MTTMICLKFILIIGLLTTITHAACPITEDPKKIINCLRFITSGIYGAVVQDVEMICSVASEIAVCARAELGECIAAEIGRAALNEIKNLADNCCSPNNHAKCPVRNGIFNGQRCFAVDSLVNLGNGKQKTIAELRSGDTVLAYNDKTKKVLSTTVLTMLDNQPNQFAMFKQLTTVSGRQLSLTSSHLLPTDIHGYIMAKNIRVGMNIYVMNDNGVLTNETISNVVDVIKQGYVAPLTQEGTLIVNNVAASCYATINSHHLAHAAVAPMRWWYGLFGVAKESNEILGIHWFPKMLYEMTTFLMPSIIHK